MGCQCIEVEVEPVTREKWETAWGQAPSQGVDEYVRGVLCARAQMEHRHNLGARIDRQPDPEHLAGAAQPRSQFVQLQVREVQVAEAALMQELSVLACASQPPGDGGLTVAEDPLSCGSIQPFGQRREHHGDLGRWSFQAIQGGVASRSERGMARLATKRLDALSMAMLAIPNERMNVSIGDPEVGALLIGAGEALDVDPFGCPPPAFYLAPGTHRRRLYARGGRGGETTGGAVQWGSYQQASVDSGVNGPSL